MEDTRQEFYTALYVGPNTEFYDNGTRYTIVLTCVVDSNSATLHSPLHEDIHYNSLYDFFKSWEQLKQIL